MTDVIEGLVVGLTPGYRRFVATWARYCGAPADVFIGQLDATVREEVTWALQDAARDVIERFQAMLAEDRNRWRALDRLLTDLDDHLAATGDADHLRRRIARARIVLGLSAADDVTATP